MHAVLRSIFKQKGPGWDREWPLGKEQSTQDRRKKRKGCGSGIKNKEVGKGGGDMDR